MMRTFFFNGRRLAMLVLFLLVGVAAMGLNRLRMDPDILGLLPKDLPEVQGLKALQQGFARHDELILLLESTTDDPDLELAEAAASLAEALSAHASVRSVQWQPQWSEGGEGIAELLAYLWLNGPETEVVALNQRLSDEHVVAAMEESIEAIATAMDGGEMVMQAHDPMGFLAHPAVQQLLAGGESGAGFESADGTTHLLLVRAKAPMSGYREANQWTHSLRKTIDEWLTPYDGNLRVQMTGEPAFTAEIGTSMERDMRGTVGVTTLLIGLLFWWMQRRLSLLFGLVGIIALVFLTALGMAGWLFGEMSIMAAGFAAILIGLTVDYGVLLCQEAKAHPCDARTLWQQSARSIFWAAVTTAAVFLALNRSALPGIAQLGTLVACGILAGAALMLGIYLPFVARVTRSPISTSPGTSFAHAVPRWVALGLIVLLGGYLAVVGLPTIGFDPALMRPHDSEAMAGFDRLEEKFPQWSSNEVRWVIEANDDSQMLARLELAEQRAETSDLISQSGIPRLWWPHEGRQQTNLANLQGLAQRRDHLHAIADEAGFTEQGLALDLQVLSALMHLPAAADLPTFPKSPAAGEITRLFVVRDASGAGFVTGVPKFVAGVEPAGKDYAKLQTIPGDGIWLSGWEMLRPATIPLVKKDLRQIFIPMAVLMIVILLVVFRNWRECLAICAAMLLTALLVLAVMRLLRIDWNFLNIAATPLLLGTSIDYGIHMAFASRRHQGDFAVMWQRTGKAVLFCAISTAIGFGSLCFASNEALASLGAVAVTGVLSSMVVCIFLLPPWLKGETKVAETS